MHIYSFTAERLPSTTKFRLYTLGSFAARTSTVRAISSVERGFHRENNADIARILSAPFSQIGTFSVRMLTQFLLQNLRVIGGPGAALTSNNTFG